MSDPRPGRFGRSIEAVWFDLYGTLVDIGPLAAVCAAAVPGRGEELAGRWRQRQLEASWLLSLMGRWRPFDAVTSDALRVAAAELAIEPAAVGRLDGAFERLPARTGSRTLLAGLRTTGRVVGILSNGTAAMISRTLEGAGLADVVDDVRSVDEVERYKPDPAVYRLAVDATGTAPERTGFVTANGWDAAGAATFGLSVAWLRSDPTAALPAVAAPPVRVASLDTVMAVLGIDP